MMEDASVVHTSRSTSSDARTTLWQIGSRDKRLLPRLDGVHVCGPLLRRTIVVVVMVMVMVVWQGVSQVHNIPASALFSTV